MVDLGTYEFKYYNTGEFTPKESFTDAYVEEVYDLKHVCTDTTLLRVILDTKYEKADLHKVMETQYQHITVTQHNELLKLLQKFEELFDGTLGTWKTDPLEFELKDNKNSVCS